MATERTRLLPKKLESGKSGLFQTSKSKECIVVIQRHMSAETDTSDNDGFYGLTLEELLPYQNDPLWLSVRRAIMLLFWAAMIVMLALTFMISAVEYNQRCKANGAMMLSANIIANLAAPIESPKPLLSA